jgi:hypothetical protein
MFRGPGRDTRDTTIVLPVALVYCGGAQLLAGMWELRPGDAFAAATFAERRGMSGFRRAHPCPRTSKRVTVAEPVRSKRGRPDLRAGP